MILNLIDDSFSHDTHSVAGVKSNYIEWDRTLSQEGDIYHSNDKINQVSTPKEKSVGLIFESRAIIPSVYEKLHDNVDKFKVIYTHSSEFLNKYDNCKWIPGGGIWIEGNHGRGSIGLKNKSKICSMVSSMKNMCPLHSLRFHMALALRGSGVDLYGLNGWVPIHQSLDDYMFSIVVENYVDDLYFTEKILNCFATGTIPIYLGARNIGEKFNKDGIITIENMEDLNKILPTLDGDLYLSKRDAIKENLNLSKQYRSLEDYIFENYLS